MFYFSLCSYFCLFLRTVVLFFVAGISFIRVLLSRTFHFLTILRPFLLSFFHLALNSNQCLLIKQRFSPEDGKWLILLIFKGGLCAPCQVGVCHPLLLIHNFTLFFFLISILFLSLSCLGEVVFCPHRSLDGF